MICAPRKKKPSATFFYRDGGRVSGVRCVWVRPAAGSVRMPCDRRCCRSAAARSLPGWGGAEPVDDDCRAPGRRSRGNCGRPVRLLCPGYFSKASRSVMSRKSSMTLSASVCASAARSSVVASATICPAPALRAASIPAGASSKTTHSAAVSPRAAAAVR